MKKEKSISINAFLNMFKTLMGIIFPLITYPYVARVLKPEYLGRVGYAQSIISYFSLIAALGISTYAVREGSKRRSNHEELQKFSNEIFTVNLINTVISYLILLILIIIVPKLRSYTLLLLLLSLSIIFTTIGVDWVNVIFEDYLVITIRSIFIQFVNLVLLFTFVKTENDYYIYAFLTVFSNMIIAIWNFIYCKKYLRIKVTRHCNFIKHFKLLFLFFANNLAITIYCNSDTTMIGWMVNDACVGLYSVAVKIYSIIKMLLSAVYTVCIPRLTNYYATREFIKFNRLINLILSGLILVLFPMVTGLIVLSKPIVFFLGGNGYESSILTLRILSFGLIFAIIGGVFSNCINIPTGNEKKTLVATIFAAVVNVILNIIFIPLFKQNGAAVTTILAEFTVMFICYISNKNIRNILDFKMLILNTFYAFSECIAILIISFLVKMVTQNLLIETISTFIISVLFYILFLIVFKNELLLDVFKMFSKHCRELKKNS